MTTVWAAGQMLEENTCSERHLRRLTPTARVWAEGKSLVTVIVLSDQSYRRRYDYTKDPL